MKPNESFHEKPRPYRIEWRAQARDDLINIIRSIEKRSPRCAAAFGKILRASLSALTQNPGSGRLSERIPHIRELVANLHYRVMYRIFYDRRIVEILGMKHAEKRLPKTSFP